MNNHSKMLKILNITEIDLDGVAKDIVPIYESMFGDMNYIGVVEYLIDEIASVEGIRLGNHNLYIYDNEDFDGYVICNNKFDTAKIGIKRGLKPAALIGTISHELEHLRDIREGRLWVDSNNDGRYLGEKLDWDIDWVDRPWEQEPIRQDYYGVVKFIMRNKV